MAQQNKLTPASLENAARNRFQIIGAAFSSLANEKGDDPAAEEVLRIQSGLADALDALVTRVPGTKDVDPRAAIVALYRLADGFAASAVDYIGPALMTASGNRVQ